MGPRKNVAALQAHRFLAVEHHREFLSAALRMQLTERPQRRLRMIVVVARTVARGNGADFFHDKG